MTLTDRIDELERARVPFVRATVVRAQEPSSAKAGDRAIVLADGSLEGFVGGHCAAGSVRTAALETLDSGEGLLLRVLPEEGEAFPDTPGARVVVNPCLSGGAMEIYLEPVLPAPVLHLVGASPTAEALATLAPAVDFVVTRADDGASQGGHQYSSSGRSARAKAQAATARTLRVAPATKKGTTEPVQASR